MLDSLEHLLFDPTVGKIVVVILGSMMIIGIAKVLKRTLLHYIKDTDNRYRVRKFLTFVPYFVIVLFLTIVFSDNLGGLTVAFGVAGAGIAFSLQEVIANLAGWVAISFGGFYRTGDRV